MRSLRNSLALVGVLAGLWLGPLSVYLAWQCGQLSAIARPSPQAMTAADFLAKGPGDNAFVELTDLEFGKPVIEQDGGRWYKVWVPVYPAGKAASQQPAFLRADRIRSQAQLDQFVKQKTLRALATRRLSSTSMWHVKPSEPLLKEYAKADWAKVTYLTLPEIVLGGTVVVPTHVLVDGTTTRAAWGASAALWLSTALGLLLLFRGDGKSFASRAPPPGSGLERPGDRQGRRGQGETTQTHRRPGASGLAAVALRAGYSLAFTRARRSRRPRRRAPGRVLRRDLRAAVHAHRARSGSAARRHSAQTLACRRPGGRCQARLTDCVADAPKRCPALVP